MRTPACPRAGPHGPQSAVGSPSLPLSNLCTGTSGPGSCLNLWCPLKANSVPVGLGQEEVGVTL